jgi:hypothetical protein
LDQLFDDEEKEVIFLIDYDRGAGTLATLRTFPDCARQEASEARLALELDHKRAGIEHEVVVLEASSEDALRRTHRRYFEDITTLAQVPGNNSHGSK